VAEGGERFQKRVGTTIRDKWHVDAFLSAGSMAAVYAATHRNGMRGALKILHQHLSRDPALKKRFLREASLANKVNHPCALRVLDDDVTEDGAAFLVMELLDGETLEVRRLRVGKLHLTDVLDIGDQLLDVLATAHEANVVHRDLKPENVLVLKNGTIKVLDFGIAQVWDGARSSENTETGTILGSPSYMPPEQARGARDEVGTRSDIWAVGATLFTLLAGETVHPGDNAHAKLATAASTPARPLQSAAPEVPRPVATVIDRALAFDKKDRWPDAGAMREALRWAAMTVGGFPAAQKRPSFAPSAPKNTDDTLTDFDVNLVAQQAKSLGDDADTTLRRRPVENTPAGALLAAAPTRELENANYLESEPTIRRDDGGGFMMGRPPDYAQPYPRAPAALAPPQRGPRRTGFLIGGAALLATAMVGGSLAFRGAFATASTPQPATPDAAPVASAIVPLPSASVAVAAPTPSAAPSLALQDQEKPAPRTVTPADLPTAPTPPPTPRRRRPPSPSVATGAPAEVDAALPSFPIPEADPSPPAAAPPLSSAAPKPASSAVVNDAP
jgi:serine/threonine-protein kinase